MSAWAMPVASPEMILGLPPLPPPPLPVSTHSAVTVAVVVPGELPALQACREE